ncbi:protocatechuate 3,4-dioxygenase subunit beta [Streptomyces sp. SID3343]|uniref:protocatechuate 3,4-dioxygenase subunit beta n=1 Tax=Streptomyces sp. SID3343 TaxID=2690260 RepID=UPI0013681A7D|nr:protocatechuate 3,4-dioxygenase subunit beta [Streptomyces sp. SID3343]MYW06526.1 protocatechuate 3,4-dioxygenase subunit beta [Streptomyces sp. SID3343]
MTTRPPQPAAPREAPRPRLPEFAWPAYKSTELRSPRHELVIPPSGTTELYGPVFGPTDVHPLDADLTRQHAGHPLGERIVVGGRVLDEAGRPLRNQLVEVWQANAAGRYPHKGDRHAAPLDPNFTGAGRCLTDDRGRYRFVTVKPGAYPWRNHHNAWRPAHIHFSLFGTAFTQRLVTQMYFPGDPLFAYDPIFNAVREASARRRMIAAFDIDTTESEWALGYRWDIVLGGASATPTEDR